MGLDKVGCAFRKDTKFILRRRKIGKKRPPNRFEAGTDLSGVSVLHPSNFKIFTLPRCKGNTPHTEESEEEII